MRKKNGCLIVILVIVSMIAGLFGAVWLNDRLRWIAYEPVVYERKEMIELFEANKELFQNAADIMKTNKTLRNALAEKDIYFHLGYDDASNKKYFEEEDWETIVELFRVVRPLEIEVYGLGGMVGFHFPLNEDMEDSANLYYEGNLNTIHDVSYYYKSTKNLGDGWYLCSGDPF